MDAHRRSVNSSNERVGDLRPKAGLALYRLVFGEPRQEDLLAFLGQASPELRPIRPEWCGPYP
jgi:hypothetical protein